MRIVMLCPWAMYPKGTVTARTLPIAKKLAEKGHDVYLVIPPFDNPSDSEKLYEIENVKICNVKISYTIPFIKHLLIVYALVKKSVGLKPDIIHVFKPKGYSGLAAMILKLYNIPLIIDTDDWEGSGGWNDKVDYHPILKKIFNFQEKWIPLHSNAVTVASKTLETQMWGFGVPPENVFYVPNGANRLTTSKDKIYNISNLHKKCGIGDSPSILLYTRFFEFDVQKIIDILKLVLADINNAKLVVVGKGFNKEEDELLALSEEAGIRESIIYTGWLQPEEIIQYIELADVAIYPYNDTLINRSKCSAKLTEILSRGKAVVADKVGQNTEYIENGVSGIVVDYDDVTSFAKNVVRILKDEHLQTMFGKNAKVRMLEKFGWDKLIIKIEEAYRKAILDYR